MGNTNKPQSKKEEKVKKDKSTTEKSKKSDKIEKSSKKAPSPSPHIKEVSVSSADDDVRVNCPQFSPFFPLFD